MPIGTYRFSKLKFEKFAYKLVNNLGALLVEVEDFIKPKVNWIIPFAIGMAVGYYL